MLSIDSDKYFALNTGSTNENLGGRALGVHVCGGVGGGGGNLQKKIN